MGELLIHRRAVAPVSGGGYATTTCARSKIYRIGAAFGAEQRSPEVRPMKGAGES